METSDKYEKMPDEFQKLFPKMHSRIKDIMEMWQKFVIFSEKPEKPEDKIYQGVMTRTD
jgi:hypothetical protein